MKILSEKDNVFEFEFTDEEREALIGFAVRRIITDEIERLEKDGSYKLSRTIIKRP